jgi:ubiquinone/menaquinone biosynthesis C-methylase UbiE
MVDYHKTLDASLSPVSVSLRRYYVDAFQYRQADSLPPGSVVLDIGGTRLQKRGVFDIEQYSFNVYYLNLATEKSPHVKADAAALPFSSDLFDGVICSELLEHIACPPAVIEAAYRVLKPGGVLLINVPFLYPIHGDPYDYGRYTDTWWRETLTRAGFTAIEMERQGGYWSVLVDMLRGWLYQQVQRQRPRPRWLRRRMEGVMNRLKRWAVRRDAQPRYREDPYFSSYTTGFGIRCQKPPVS